MAVRSRIVALVRSRVRDAILEMFPSYRNARSAVDRRTVARLLREHELRQTQQALVQLHTTHNHLETAGLAPPVDGERPVIVSLTTIPSRFGNVHLTIESVFQQTRRPHRVLLWLDDASFAGRELTPGLERLRARGLEIRTCEDTRSYKKLLPALAENPDATIVTIDDDCFYPPRWLELLLDASQAHPGAVVYHRGRAMVRVGASRLAPYADWPLAATGDVDVVPTGVGGVLYPPGCFRDDEVLNVQRARELCPTADDLWFRAMTLRVGTRVVQVPQALVVDEGDLFSAIHSLPSSQIESLFAQNKDRNDAQVHAVLDAYQLWDRLGSAFPRSNQA